MLSWHATGVQGQTLRFQSISKRSTQTIIDSSRSSGHVRFVPVDDGSGGRRLLRVLVSHDGIPHAELRAGSFSVPHPQPPSPVRRVRITRRGARASIIWAAAPTAAGYGVYVTVGDGRRLFFDLKASQRRIEIPHVGSSAVTAKVLVQARSGRTSRPTTRSLGRRRPHAR